MIILASQSPRRRELLTQIGVPFEVLSVDIDESPHANEAPSNYVQRITQAKAEAAQALRPNHAILAADTAVVLDGTIMGKPRDRSDFLSMFKRLSGRSHQVFTGVALHDPRERAFRLNVSRVHFRPLSHEEMIAYWHSGEPQDKAGGYAIQGLGALFIQSIEGSYSGIMGLPLYETGELLRARGLLPQWPTSQAQA